MFKKTALFLLLIAVLLSACGGQPTATIASPTETPAPPTETLAPTSTPVPEPSLTPTPAEDPTATATALPPENAAGCVNAGKFISDVSIPDNSNVNINTVFTKTWRVQNTGTCIWWYGYTLTHYSELSLGAPEFVTLPLTNPGESADISIELVAPSVAGLYRGNFVIRNPEGLPMEIEGDSRLWVAINAVDSGGAAATSTTEASGGTGGGGGTNPVACTYTVDPNRVNDVLKEINAYRAGSGLAAYTLNAQLSTAAQAHAGDMACNQLFVHVGSDGSTPATRAAAAGYMGEVAENLYGSYPPLTPEEVKDWWRLDQTDSTHNLNLLSSEYVEVGIGYAFYDNFGFYVVVFGVP